VDKAPVEIVSDPRRPDRTVENGLSCMSCHTRGIIPKADQVRTHVEKNAQAYSRADVEAVKALYVPEARTRALMEEDTERFVAALKKAGVPADGTEPVAATALRYEAVLDLAAVAAEFGLRTEDFSRRLNQSPALARALGSSLARGGTVQRQALQTAFPEVVREFRLVEDKATPPAATAGPTRFTGHSEKILCLAFSPDGRLAVSGSEDRTLRLWDVTTGKELGRLEGHRDAVTAAAFSADGRTVLSGGKDRTLRLWDVATDKELRRFSGHADAVRTVALSPDGRRALSGGADRSLRVWDVETGKELATFTGHKGAVTCVAFSPDGRLALSGSTDYTAAVWDLEARQLRRRLTGHAREVFSVAFSPDGRRALSGGEDKTARLWDVESGEELRRLEGHANAVICVAFAPDGRRILTASSQYQAADQTLRLWDAQSGKQLWAHGGKDGDGVTGAAFSPDGRQALTANLDIALRLWQLAK
jgi:hypothetical protein